jgi:MoxR-like ATPase
MAEIEFTTGPIAGRRLKLTAESYTLGRRRDLDLALDDGMTSGEHADIRFAGGAWMIVDHGSSNGTWLNDAKITSAPLSNGDVVQIGGSSFIFHADAAPANGGTPPPVASSDELALVEKMRDRADQIRREVGKVIVGQIDVLDQVLMCILANGHALLIGLPGMAKTLMVRTIAQVLNLKFKRVQFTPDLMPGDIIGTDVLETNSATGEKEFRFIRGPIFCNLLLADEINRTPPKTQAALLEAMQEKMVTAGNTSYTLEEPFFVLATQNPIEQEGTYPLPEAQLDRFMFNIWVDYPLPHEEEEILRATTGGKRIDPKAVLTQAEVLQLQAVVRKVPVSDHVIKYVTRLVGATRPQNENAPQVTKTYVSTGAGPRAGQYLILAAKAMAILEGRIHVSCADIRRAAPPVLRHRILTNFAADSEGLTPLAIVKKLIEQVPEPGAEAYAAPVAVAVAR